jgi:hypothetical protein
MYILDLLNFFNDLSNFNVVRLKALCNLMMFEEVSEDIGDSYGNDREA